MDTGKEVLEEQLAENTSDGEAPIEEPQTGSELNGKAVQAVDDKSKIRLPNLFWALVPILSMVGLMLYVFGYVADSDAYDAAHMPLLCSTVVACAVGIAYGRTFKYMLQGILDRLLVSMEAILILLLVGLLSPIYAFITAALGRNIFWADGSYTNILGKTKVGKPAACPDDVRELALANLEAARKAGKAPYPSA